MHESTREPSNVLVTAATGYIGSHLLEPLVKAGFRVRAAARRPEAVAAVEGVDVVAFDALEPGSVQRALADVDVAYYLVHTLGAGSDYAERDRRAAEIFAAAAKRAGVGRVVFFGGLGREDVAGLSEHLASRHEVGRVLASAGVPVIEFRAAVVIGSGSTSFEMIRNLVEKLPAMTTPKWVRQPSQPIAIDDVVAYLVAAATRPALAEDAHVVYEVGGGDVVTYGDLLRSYAELRGLHRLVIPVPVLSPGLSGWWLYLFTPKQATVGRQLAESLRFPTVVNDDSALRDFPDIAPIGMSEAMQRAFAAEDESFAAARWQQRLAARPAGARPWFELEGRYVDSRTLHVECPPEAAFDPIACIGGENGWYAFDTLWDVRGVMDNAFGGPGRRRGRTDQYALEAGDSLDWWRVERVVYPSFLRLVAEMRLPGKGWLQYELSPEGEGTCVRQTAVFEPKGLLGRAYWYAVLPFHHFVFTGTLKGIERECRALVTGPATCPLPGRYERGIAERSKGTDSA